LGLIVCSRMPLGKISWRTKTFWQNWIFLMTMKMDRFAFLCTRLPTLSYSSTMALTPELLLTSPSLSFNLKRSVSLYVLYFVVKQEARLFTTHTEPMEKEYV